MLSLKMAIFPFAEYISWWHFLDQSHFAVDVRIYFTSVARPRTVQSSSYGT